jgi:ATP-dependent DNA helicase RecG
MTAGQALEFWPRAYQDRTTLRRIADLSTGQEGIVLATVQGVRQKRMRNGRAMLEVSVIDGSASLGLVFFNAPPWKEKQVKPGDALLCWGRVSEGWSDTSLATRPTSPASCPSTLGRPAGSTRRCGS